MARYLAAALPHRDPGLARHPGLAEPATISFNAPAIPAVRSSHLPEIIPALALVMPGCRNRPGGQRFWHFLQVPWDLET
jgi:hypothetical protein